MREMSDKKGKKEKKFSTLWNEEGSLLQTSLMNLPYNSLHMHNIKGAGDVVSH